MMSTQHTAHSIQQRAVDWLPPANRLFLAPLLVCGSMLFHGIAGAHSEEAAVSYRTYSPITVDGKLDDWVRRLERSDWKGRLSAKKGEVLESIRAVPLHVNALTAAVESGAIANSDDFSAEVYTLWDPQSLYLAAVVTDDHVVVQHEGADIWQDDSLEVWFDCRHDAVTHTLFQDDEYQLGFSPAGPDRTRALAWAWRNPRAEAVTPSLRVASSLIPGGYLIEAAVPWTALQGCQPSVGGVLGFNISMVDKDADQLWTHVTWSGRLHSDPSQFGHLHLLDAPVDLFPSDVFETKPEGAPWEVQ